MLVDGDDRGRAALERGLEIARSGRLPDWLVGWPIVNLGSACGEMYRFDDRRAATCATASPTRSR